MEFFFGADFGFRAHPLEGVDVLVHGGFDVVDHLEGFGLAVAGEVLVDVDLAEGFAESAVDGGGAALPAGTLGGDAFELTAVEVEVLSVDGLGQLAGEGAEEMEAHVGAKGVHVGVVDGGDHGGEEFGVGVDEGVEFGGVNGFEEGAEVCGRDAFVEGGDGLGMVDGFGVAALGVGHGGEGEFGFEGEDVGGVALSVGGSFTGEGEHLRDEGYVLVAELLVLGSGAGVVVALGKAETALINDGDLLGGVFEVLLFAEAKEDVDVVALELAGERGEVGLGDGADLIEEGLDGSEALLVDERGIHAGGVVVADFLLVGSAVGIGRGVFGEDAVELLGVDVVEGVELVDAGLVGGDGIVGGEVAAGVLVEVGAGVGGFVDGCGVECGGGEVVGLGRRGGGLREDGEGKGSEGGAECEGGERAVHGGCTTREGFNH